MSYELDRGKCRSCGAPILWAWTPSGARIPLDAESNPAGELTLHGDYALPANAHSRRRYRTHFETCPKAAKHRRPRP